MVLRGPREAVPQGFHGRFGSFLGPRFCSQFSVILASKMDPKRSPFPYFSLPSASTQTTSLLDPAKVFPRSQKAAIWEPPTFDFTCKTQGKTAFSQIRLVPLRAPFPSSKVPKKKPKMEPEITPKPKRSFQKQCRNLGRFSLPFLSILASNLGCHQRSANRAMLPFAQQTAHFS